MSAGTSYDTDAPSIEVRELCESEEEAATVVEQWAEVADVYGLADDLPTSGDDANPIASAPVPGFGTE